MANARLQFRNLKWNTEHLTFAQLLDKCPLPQIVKVTEGFRGEFSDKVLFLQSVKPIQKAHGRLSCGKVNRQIAIPLDCESKVEVRSSDLKDVYESVEELCSVFPPFVRVTKGFHDDSGRITLSVGDKLQLKGIDKSRKKDKKLVCLNQNGQQVKLSKNCAAAFQPLADGNEYYLSDVLKKFEMPVNVQFIEPYYSIGKDRSGNKSSCEPFQTICLQRVSIMTAITGTLINDDGSFVMVQFSQEVKIKLVACQDRFRNSVEYAKICEIFSQDIESEDIYTHPYEYIDEDAFEVHPKAVKPSPKGAKPVVHRKPRRGNPTAVQDESIPIYETVDFVEEKDKYSTYTAFNPKYASNHQYECPVDEKTNKDSESRPKVPEKPYLPIKLPSEVPDSTNAALNPIHISTQYEKPTPSSENQPKAFDKPQLPKRGITLPRTRHPSLFEDPTTKISKSKSLDRAPKRAENSTSTHDTPPENPNRILEGPSNIPGAHRSPPRFVEIAQYPQDLTGLNVAAVGTLLTHLRMEKHVEIFASELIDGSMLASLDKESLKSLGLSPFHVTKLLKFIAGWRPNLARSSKY